MFSRFQVGSSIKYQQLIIWPGYPLVNLLKFSELRRPLSIFSVCLGHFGPGYDPV